MDRRGPVAMVVNNGPAYEFAQRFANLGGAKPALEGIKNVQERHA